ncbi:MAG: DUF1292 domain-containing protein [Lachnospiraceae bacterium]|nr:DUF1292 domain-containing protein [Lachnospiraceae bacterium]
MENNYTEEYKEYVTFHTTSKDGADLEMAVMDEFDYEGRHYVVGALIKDDEIQEDGRYIYRSIITGDEFTVEKIRNEIDYNRIARAYMEMEE